MTTMRSVLTPGLSISLPSRCARLTPWTLSLSSSLVAPQAGMSRGRLTRSRAALGRGGGAGQGQASAKNAKMANGRDNGDGGGPRVYPKRDRKTVRG